jgi:hypothetical protein
VLSIIDQQHWHIKPLTDLQSFLVGFLAIRNGPAGLVDSAKATIVTAIIGLYLFIGTLTYHLLAGIENTLRINGDHRVPAALHSSAHHRQPGRC